MSYARTYKQIDKQKEITHIDIYSLCMLIDIKAVLISINTEYKPCLSNLFFKMKISWFATVITLNFPNLTETVTENVTEHVIEIVT